MSSELKAIIKNKFMLNRQNFRVLSFFLIDQEKHEKIEIGEL